MDLPINPTRKNRFSESDAFKVITDNEKNFGIVGAAGLPTDRSFLENSKTSYWGDDGRLFQYPLDLGTDSTHYIIFNIYETDGAEFKDEDNGDALSDQYTTHIRNQNELLEEANKKSTSAANLGMFGMMTNNSFFMNMAARKSRQADQLGYEASAQTISAMKTQRKLNELDISHTNKDKREALGTKVSSTRVNEPKIVGKDSIILYMPHKINSMNMIDYDLEKFDTVKAAQEAYRNIGEGNYVDAVGNLGGMVVGKILKGIGDVASAVGIGSPMDVLKVFGRIAINPQKEMLFNSPAPRKYEFAFEFAPRNKEESIQVRNIVQLFKYHAFPATTLGSEYLDKLAASATSADKDMDEKQKAASTWYKMPAEFQFEYMHIDKSSGQEIAVENHYINRAERCVLTEVNVDYSGAGSFQSFEDGSPTHITLTLTFAEARLITQEHIAKGY